MAFRLRQESVAVADNVEKFEQEQATAASQGAVALENFQTDKLATAIKEGAGDAPASTPSDTSTNDTSSSDDGGGDDSGFDDMPTDGDNPDEPSPDGNPDEDENQDEDPDAEAESEDADADAEAEAEPDGSGDDAELKTEHFRYVDPIPSDVSMRFEEGFMSAVKDVALRGWEGFSFVAGMLAGVGLKYGPSVLSGMFKVVLYTFARTFQLLMALGSACAQRIERYMQSSAKQKARLVANVESLKEKIEAGARLPNPEPQFEFVTSLMGNRATDDLAKILRAQADFTTKTFGVLLQGARHEFRHLQEISHNRYLGRHFDAMIYLNDDRNFGGVSKTTSMRINPPEGTDYYSLGKMPAGGFECVANFPKEADNWNQIEKNYNAAGFSLIGSGATLSLAPCQPKQLVDIMSAIDYMIESNKKHQLFYEELASARSGVLTAVRALFVQLVQSQTRVSFKDSVALPLFLKTSIATKVYLVAAMDLQDHNAKVIANALDYVERVKKLYHVPEAKESASSL